MTNGRWETVHATVENLANDPEASDFERPNTRFRVTLVTLDGLRFGMNVLVQTRRLTEHAWLYGDVLDRAVRDIENALKREGQVAV